MHRETRERQLTGQSQAFQMICTSVAEIQNNQGYEQCDVQHQDQTSDSTAKRKLQRTIFIIIFCAQTQFAILTAPNIIYHVQNRDLNNCLPIISRLILNYLHSNITVSLQIPAFGNLSKGPLAKDIFDSVPRIQ